LQIRDEVEVEVDVQTVQLNSDDFNFDSRAVDLVFDMRLFINPHYLV
jgi:RNase adaptor protein for sRNA GlmZ degradation